MAGHCTTNVGHCTIVGGKFVTLSLFLCGNLCCDSRDDHAAHCSILQHTATHCNTLQHTATHGNTRQHTATHCNTLQHTATHCNTLQHTATHCNTLQHTPERCINCCTMDIDLYELLHCLYTHVTIPLYRHGTNPLYRHVTNSCTMCIKLHELWHDKQHEVLHCLHRQDYETSTHKITGFFCKRAL